MTNLGMTVVGRRRNCQNQSLLCLHYIQPLHLCSLVLEYACGSRFHALGVVEPDAAKVCQHSALSTHITCWNVHGNGESSISSAHDPNAASSMVSMFLGRKATEISGLEVAYTGHRESSRGTFARP